MGVPARPGTVRPTRAVPSPDTGTTRGPAKTALRREQPAGDGHGLLPQRIALDFKSATLTHTELLEASERAAWLLHRAGVRHGDRAPLLLPNCPQHVVAI
ncbi:AMP-binding protein [Actinomyces lilanjuaniae]|uniref:AMP-binding protein n=1 Tax=Actinomyces lilanjuaniae TaxID=2321394 RepID=UPI00311AAEAD